jgi:hypothetical protein
MRDEDYGHDRDCSRNSEGCECELRMALKAEIERLKTRLAEATEILKDGLDANFNEVGECEDDDWFSRVRAFADSSALEP